MKNCNCGCQVVLESHQQYLSTAGIKERSTVRCARCGFNVTGDNIEEAHAKWNNQPVDTAPALKKKKPSKLKEKLIERFQQLSGWPDPEEIADAAIEVLEGNK